MGKWSGLIERMRERSPEGAFAVAQWLDGGVRGSRIEDRFQWDFFFSLSPRGGIGVVSPVMRVEF
jgi:hypothetical protein